MRGEGRRPGAGAAHDWLSTCRSGHSRDLMIPLAETMIINADRAFARGLSMNAGTPAQPVEGGSGVMCVLLGVERHEHATTS